MRPLTFKVLVFMKLIAMHQWRRGSGHLPLPSLKFEPVGKF